MLEDYANHIGVGLLLKTHIAPNYLGDMWVIF
jgi:hypothetical protein